MAIDIHTHLFNVRYLPLKGIIRARAPHWSKPMANALVTYLLWRSKDDPVLDRESLQSSIRETASTETLTIDQFLSTRMPLSEEDTVTLLEELATEAAEDEKLLYHEDIIAAIEELLIAENPAKSDSLGGQPSQDLEGVEPAKDDHLLVELAPKREARSFDRSEQRRLFRRLFKKFAELGKFFDWAVFMTRPESEIWKTLNATYGGKVKLFVDHMMDMEKHYPKGKAKYETPQIRMDRMRRLYRHIDGLAVGFYAWCPLRDNCMELVKTALEEQGFCGVKFYPPNGYRASGNTGMDQVDKKCKLVREDRNGDWIHGEVIDERNEELFSYCQQNHIPIFAHCQPGEMESAPNYSGRLSHPKFWAPVLAGDKFPNLILCFGHAGGAKQWVAPVEGNDPWKITGMENPSPCCSEAIDPDVDLPGYSRAVYELCTDGAPNVFSGTGAHEEIFDGGGIENFQRRLELLILDSTQNRQSDFGRRIIYGTDWHMIYRHDEHPFYLDTYEKAFDESSPIKDYRNRFFEENALEFLHLRHFIDRCRDHLSSNQVDAINEWIS